MGTPHNEAKKGDFAKTVLMPGDPLRSKFIAETFLTDLKLVNNVRGVQGYTGLYKGVPVSVMASGMGMPSIGIYSYELYTQYDVENIIRVGSAGALRADLELGSVVAGQGACANSAYLEQYELGGTFAPIADFDLLMAAVESAKELGVKMPVGNLYSSDTFYDAAGRNARFGKMEKDGKILYRYVAKDYRIYFEVIEGKVIVHRVLHANSLNDFLFRTNISPTAGEDEILSQSKHFWKLIDEGKNASKA